MLDLHLSGYANYPNLKLVKKQSKTIFFTLICSSFLFVINLCFINKL